MDARATLSCLPIPAIVIDATGAIVFVTARWADLAGVSDGVGRAAELVLADPLLAEIEHVRQRRGDGVVDRVPLAATSGEDTFRATVGIAPDDAVVVVFADVAEELSLMQQLDDQRAVVEQAAHDLGSPLSAIAMWCAVLPRCADDATRGRAIDAITRSADVASQIVTDLVDTARAWSGELLVEIVPTSVDVIVATAIAQGRDRASERGCTLVARVDERLGSVMASDKVLARVIDRMIARCLRAGARRIELDAQIRGHRIALRVARDGPSERTHERDRLDVAVVRALAGAMDAEVVVEPAFVEISLAQTSTDAA